MPQEFSRDRLADLLADPREDLDFEAKNWLDLQDSPEDKATFAKAVLALANHGGGFVTLGLTETDEGLVEAVGRPATLDRYSQDRINNIVQAYSDPQFHCAVHLVPNPEGVLFPIVVVPGSHKVPVRARRAGPNGNIIHNNAIYVRKPGPRSEAPHNSHEWDELISRCLINRRDEMLDQIRDLITGAVRNVDQSEESDRLDEWITDSQARWRQLTRSLPAEVGPRLPHGHYSFAYEIEGEVRATSPAQFPEILRASVVRHTGWPPFWYPTRQGIEPYAYDGAVECWIGGDPDTPAEDRDAAHSDFWRIHPSGYAYLLRGFEEDGAGIERYGANRVPPGTLFDINLPVWRIGEAVLQAQRLAANLFHGPTTIRFVVNYSGLAGRQLTSLNQRRHVWENRIARQDSIILSTHVDTQSIDANLPEVVHPLLSPLYALFDFFDLPMQLVADELGRMRR